MYYTIYQITNTINEKIYIGKHQTTDPNDSYYGSGKLIKSAIKKYGKENFIKKILFVFDTEDEMNVKEKELITEEFVSRKDTYNTGVGGEGGPHFRGKTHSDEARKKMGSSGRKISEEARKKISESNRNRVVSEETRKKLSEIALLRNSKELNQPSKSIKEKYVMTEEHKKKISSSVKKNAVLNENVIQTTICPHCKKEGQLLAMRRHHFNNCKSLAG